MHRSAQHTIPTSDSECSQIFPQVQIYTTSSVTTFDLQSREHAATYQFAAEIEIQLLLLQLLLSLEDE